MKTFLKTLVSGALSTLFVLGYVSGGYGAIQTFIAMNSLSGWLAVGTFFLGLVALALVICGMWIAGLIVMSAFKAKEEELTNDGTENA